jgi:hypothetical protein
MNEVGERFSAINGMSELAGRIAAWREFVQAEPGHAPAWFNYAGDLRIAHDWLGARRAALRGFAIDPARRTVDRALPVGQLVWAEDYEIVEEVHATEYQVLYRAQRDGRSYFLRRLRAGGARGTTDGLVRAFGLAQGPDGAFEVLEHVPGRTLHELIEIRGVDVEVAATVVEQTARMVERLVASGVDVVELRPETLIRADELGRGVVALGPLGPADRASAASPVEQLGLLLYRATTRRPLPTRGLHGERVFGEAPAEWPARWRPLLDLVASACAPDASARPRLEAWTAALRAIIESRPIGLDTGLRKIGGITISGQLGEGRFGSVHRGLAPDGSPRAVKILFPHFTADGDTVLRFRNEAEIANRIQSDGIIRVHGQGRTEEGLCYIVMDLAQGGSVEELLAKRPTSPRAAVALGVTVAHAMTAVHRAGVVHRDLKPSNLLLDRAGDTTSTKICDFGIAKLLGEPTQAGIPFTMTGHLLGSPLYMAPEQWKMEDVDGRADIYALGVILHRAISGELPFRGGNEYQLQQAHLHEIPRPLTELGAPRQLAAVVARMLAKDPAQRYASMEEVEAALRACSLDDAPRRAPRRRRRIALALAALVVAGAVGATVVVAGGAGNDHGGGAPAPGPDPGPGPGPTLNATVYDPVSNVRSGPSDDDPVLCTVDTVTDIRVFDHVGRWYATDYCGSPGYIHDSQFHFK